MSYQQGGACFETVGMAAKAAAAGVLGQVVPAGSVVYVVDAVGNADGSITYTLGEVGTSATVTHTAAPSWPECQLLQAADAAAMGWGVLVAWIGAWAVLLIRKGW
jgi:hypothetical protein